eukprot:2661138-Pleurochrysis_carterae.AAC.1
MSVNACMALSCLRACMHVGVGAAFTIDAARASLRVRARLACGERGWVRAAWLRACVPDVYVCPTG